MNPLHVWRHLASCTGLTGLLLLGTLAAHAQASPQYRVHIVLRDGSDFQKTYPNAESLNQDPALRKLRVGGVERGRLAFRPDEQRHQAFLVEELVSGQRKHLVFQAWDVAAARRVEGGVAAAPGLAVGTSLLPRGQHQAVAPEAKSRDLASGLAVMLRQAGLLSTEQRYHIRLTRDVLQINRQTQPAEVHAKFRAWTEQFRHELLTENFCLDYEVTP